MYSTCLFCHASLGANEVLEQFPVGRRLAFDPMKGRLWVVCPKCARWNLSPIEERWEVQEECERRFRSTRLRYSTAQIGLARLGDGLELVRIGEPLRPEMAAWRYGAVFGRRMRKRLMVIGGTLAAVGGAFWAAPMLGLSLGGLGVAGQMGYALTQLYRFHTRAAARIHTDRGAAVNVTQAQVIQARLNREKWDWNLEIDFTVGRFPFYQRGSFILHDEAAIRAAAVLLPLLNPAVGRRRTVNAAVDLLEQSRSVDDCFRTASRVESTFLLPPLDTVLLSHVARSLRGERRPLPATIGAARPPNRPTLAGLPAPIRLALEMAAHEEVERAALEDDLLQLEQAWREAEEIAAIADTLLLPEGTETTLERYRRAGDPLPPEDADGPLS